jgi:glycosyltransferase involved in cell wall biosynthesis
MREMMKDSAYSHSQPRISIITPSYNQGHYLEETINSIISQQYANYELIIIDAGSTDNTVEVIKKYEDCITHWVSEPDRGQSHAIRKGLEVATGDIINWINSDDLVAPGAFHRIAAEFDLSRYDVFCGRCDYFVNDLAQLDLRGMRMELAATVGEVIIQHKINQPSTFFSAAVIKQLDIDEQFRYTMDVDLWYRYLLGFGRQRVLLSEALLTYFRLHETSKSVAENTHFVGDTWKVHYNILHTLGADKLLLRYASQHIPQFEQFLPTRYIIRVESAELKPFVRHVAWLALPWYNEQGDYAAACQCLTIARRNGQPLSRDVVKKVIKHYLLPENVLRWLVKRRQSSTLV